MLDSSYHGKDRVRVAKVRRNADGVHDFVEYEVRIELRGGTDTSFLSGDNSQVVATDTCKNHVYLTAKDHPCDSPESFGVALCKRVLTLYAHVNSVHVRVVEKPWRRIQAASGRLHDHGFCRLDDGTHVALVKGSRDQCEELQLEIRSRIESRLVVLKTTQSGWENFLNDEYTTLPSTSERILSTSIDAEWEYNPQHSAMTSDAYINTYAQIKQLLLDEFFGPPAGGHYSAGVQETLYKMGESILSSIEPVKSVTLELPNIHFIPCNIPAFMKNGVKFEDDVYIPTDEPHGIISATVHRS